MAQTGRRASRRPRRAAGAHRLVVSFRSWMPGSPEPADMAVETVQPVGDYWEAHDEAVCGIVVDPADDLVSNVPHHPHER